jgi:hypothetical protein
LNPPMKNFLAPAIALMLGIGLGILITKSIGSANAVHVAESQSPDDGTASNLRTRPSSRTSPAGKSTTGQTAASPRSLAGLLGLVGDKWNAQPSIAFLEAIEGLDAEEITAMMSDLEKFDPSDARRSRLCNALINRWAAIDPDGAWDAAMKFDDKNLKRQMITSVIGVISRSDLGKARQLLAGIKDQQIKQNALYSFINQASTQDPEEAFRMLTSDSENSQNYSHHYQTLFQKWAKEDPEAAIAKLNLIKGNSERQQALQGIAVALVASDPQRALDLLDGTPPGQSRASMLSKRLLAIDPRGSRQGIKVLGIASRKQPNRSPVFAIGRSVGTTRPRGRPEVGRIAACRSAPGTSHERDHRHLGAD